MRPVVLLLACLLTAGCATTVSRPPAPPPTSTAPSRPREVRLNGVDPCSLLTPTQRAELGLTSKPAYSKSRVELFRGEVPTCTMDNSTAILGIGLVTTAGIERWQEDGLAADTRPTTVRGFPAVVAKPTRSTSYCSVDVDVASGQLVDVQFVHAGSHSPPPQDQLCSTAELAANKIIETLADH